MGDRTEELRELFESVTGTESVTERQRRPRGSLGSDTDPREALAAEIEAMRSAHPFETELSTSVLATVVERFYDGETDVEIAAEFTGQNDAIDPSTVAKARLDLHLVRESDRPDSDARPLFEAVSEGTESVDVAAQTLDVSAATVEFWLRVREAQIERRQVADRYRQAFETILQDRDIGERLTASLEETGLDEAVADQEVDVDM
jgi:hypothetical protein